MALVSVTALLGKVGDAVNKIKVIFTDGIKRVKTREELCERLFGMSDEMQYWREEYSSKHEEVSWPLKFDDKVFTVRLLACSSELMFCDGQCFGCRAAHLYVDGKKVGFYFDEEMLMRLLREVAP